MAQAANPKWCLWAVPRTTPAMTTESTSERAGHTLSVAGDGPSLTRDFRSGIDAVVLDLTLPLLTRCGRPQR
jgi:hypothetical protein